MSVWAIADLHLALGDSGKSMEVFGPKWKGYVEAMERNWRQEVGDDDLVLVAGDISWAMKAEQAKVDLEWIDQLPGTKVMIRGNHDYWWSSMSKVRAILPPSIHVIQNDAFHWSDISVAGTRLWDTDEYAFDGYIDYQENLKTAAKKTLRKDKEKQEKIFLRELQRLELSLQCLDPQAKWRIAMTHYPPLGAEMDRSRASGLLEKYHVDVCVFGHLHSIKAGIELFGQARGITYSLTSCDYLDFKPLRVLD